MPIEQTTPMSDIDAYIVQRIATIEKVVMRSLMVLGEKCLNAARMSKSYKDQTGNLRSSVGYVIVKDGRIVTMSDFNSVKDGHQGSSEGQDYVRRLVSDCEDGIVLIVVAGMNYAKYVSARGYDVLDSAEDLAIRELPGMLRKLKITQ